MAMSSNGIQLNTQAELTYFHPSIREYWQSIRDAVVSNNLSEAEQAFTQLRKAIESLAQEQTSEPAQRISQGLQDVGQALEAGDLSSAAQALGKLSANIASMSQEQSKPQEDLAAESVSSTGTAVSLREGDDPDTGTFLNVNV
jgi:hypothetical protein